jgi:hypothetical protein
MPETQVAWPAIMDDVAGEMDDVAGDADVLACDADVLAGDRDADGNQKPEGDVRSQDHPQGYQQGH